MSLANRMALASEHVHALTVEANEFPELSRQFGVSGVPRTVINRTGAFVGALPQFRVPVQVPHSSGMIASNHAAHSTWWKLQS